MIANLDFDISPAVVRSGHHVFEDILVDRLGLRVPLESQARLARRAHVLTIQVVWTGKNSVGKWGSALPKCRPATGDEKHEPDQ